MTNSVDPYQLASSAAIWIYTVCKGRAYLGSAGPGLIPSLTLKILFLSGVLASGTHLLHGNLEIQ